MRTGENAFASPHDRPGGVNYPPGVVRTLIGCLKSALMDHSEFTDAFLDREYLKLNDEGTLNFIFTKERVQRAKELPVDEAEALLQKHHDALVEIYRDTTKRILIEAFYTELFEELADKDDEVALAFINLVLGRVRDEEAEKARVEEVRKFQAKRQKK